MSLALDVSKKSPKREISMVVMEIESVTTQCLPNGHLVIPGKSTIKVYEDEVDDVMSLVRDDAENQLIELAKSEFKKRLERYATEKCEGDMERAKDLFPESVESVYCSQNSGSGYYHIRPLTSARIIEKGLPPPSHEERYNVQAGTAGLVADVIKTLLTDESVISAIAGRIRKELNQGNQGNNNHGKRN